LIPGRQNRVLLDANRVGVFRGQCAEFCGLQHAHMAMRVVVQPRTQFQAWLRNMSGPARPPQTAEQRRGQAVFLSQTCSACHQVRGTNAAGQVGPDLTHLATRQTLAAVTIPNSPAELAEWIRDPQHVKPGSKMPDLELTNADVTALVAYLGSLK
jgi:cytochrome c oxidase subunit 2